MVETRTIEIFLGIFFVIVFIGWFMGIEISILITMFFVLIGFAYFELIDRKYPVKVIAFIRRKAGFSVMFDYATRVFDKKTKMTHYKLKNLKKLIKPQDFGNIIETKKGLFSILYSPSPDEYRPMTIRNKDLDIMDEDMKFWHSQNILKAYQRFEQKQSKWQVYMPLISLIVLGMLMAIILYANSQYMAGVTSQLAQAANTLADAVREFSIPSVVPPH